MFRLISCLFFIATKSNTQCVNVPDGNFRSDLIAKYPSCFSGAGLMDTTCGLILNEIDIIADHWHLDSLERIDYFKNINLINYWLKHTIPDSLVDLVCRCDKISILSPLPNSVNNLFCDSNKITHLPQLPFFKGIKL
jgi:hypothetical protein